MGLSQHAQDLLELRQRGWFDAADAVEICDRCWRKAQRAIRELQIAGLIKRRDNRPMRRASWTFAD